MMKKVTCIILLLILFSFAGCSSISEPSLSPELATDTAILSRKSTEAAAASVVPATAFPTEVFPTFDWTDWTPSPGEIVASDSGQTYNFVLTSRFSVVLSELDYPIANLELNCVPNIVLGRISNVDVAPPDYYVVRFEGSGIGQCIIRNGSFEVTINIIDRN